MNISKKINKWQEAGIISAEQASKLTEFENNNVKPYLVNALSFLSMFLIGCGIIAEIAANWDYIPAYVKIGMNFAMLSACGAGVYYMYDKKSTYFEGLLFLYGILCVATIGLVNQIYQLSSDAKDPMIWSTLMMPLVLFSRKTLFPFLVFIVFHASCLECVETFDLLFYILNNAPLLILFTYIILYQCMEKWLPNFAVGFMSALKFVIIAMLALAVLVLDSSDFVKLNADPLYILFLVFLCAVSFYLSYLNKKKYFINYIMVIVLIASLIPMHFIVGLSSLTVLGCYAYHEKMVRLLNWSILLIGVRIYMLYIQLCFSLMVTGFGFIISGLVLLGLLMLWKKASKYFNRRMNNEK